MREELFLIRNDLFSIADRVREIDSNYKIYYNRRLARYEVHNTKRGGKSLQLVLPDKQLDARAIAKIEETHIKHIEEILRSADKENEQIEKSKEAKLSDMAKYKAKSLVNFIDKGGFELPSFDEI